MGNCQTKSATVVADCHQEPPPPCRSDSYSIDLGGGGSHSSDASSVDDARLMISKASDEEMDIHMDGEESSAIRANLQPLDALELAESFHANKMEATATATGIEFGFGLVSDGAVDVRTSVEQDEPAATTSYDDKLTIVTSADISAMESTKPPKSTSCSTRTSTRNGTHNRTRSSSRSSSSRRHRSRSRSSRRAASPGPGLPKASTSSIADRRHLLDELDGLVASFSMPSAATSNDRESDSGDEFDGLEESVIGVVPLPGEESTPVEAKGKDGKAADTTEDFPQAINGAIVPFDADVFRYGDSRALVPAVGTDDNNANADDKMEEDKVQLAIGSAPKMCAYEITAEDVDAVTKSNNDMMVVHEPNTKGNAEDNHFGDRFTFQRDETRDDQACKDHHSSAIVPTTAVAPPMLTPPNDPNKSMPSELYLSPESEEDEDDDRLFSEGLFAVPLLMPDGYQAETTTSTTEIVPHASNTTNTNEESNANAIVEFAGDISSLIPAGYDFGDHPPMPTKTSKSVEPQEQSNNTAGEAEIEAQLCGPTENKFDEVATNVTESSKTVVSVETQQTETKVTIPENPHTKPVTSSMSVASMSRLSRRAKNYRATAINKGTRTEPKKAVQGTTDNAAAVVKSKAVVEEEVSIAETKSIDLSIIECNSDETEVSEITSNHTDLDEASVTSKASHRARQLRSRSAVRHGRGMSVERRGGMSDDKEIKDPSTASVKSALPPVPKAASITSVNALSTEPSDGGKTEDHPSTTTSSCRLARSRRSRSRSVRRATSVQQRSRTTATKKDEEVGYQKKDDSPQKMDESIGHKAGTIESEPKEQDKKEEEIKMTSDSKSNGDAANEQMKTSEANNIVEKKNTSTRRPRTLSQRRAMAARLGKDTCVRAILGEKDTSAINNGESQTSTKPRGQPAPESDGKSSQSLSDRKARAARMKKAVDASSISSSCSIDTSSSSVENGENSAAPVDTKPSMTVDSMEKSVQDKKEMARKRSERARRLRALQN